MENAYRSDLAYIHDAGYGHLARNGAAYLLDQLRHHKKESGRVVELGCGSGISSEAITAAGYDVQGFDISAEMIALARRRVPQAEFRAESFLTAELPSCIAVTAFGEPLNYLFDTDNTKRALAKLFRRIHDALEPGGLLLFDVAVPGRVRGGGPQQAFREGDDWAVLVTLEVDRQHKLLTRRITSFRKVGELYRRDFEIHRQRLFERGKLSELLRDVGFCVRPLVSYGTFRFPRGLIGFLGRKA